MCLSLRSCVFYIGCVDLRVARAMGSAGMQRRVASLGRPTEGSPLRNESRTHREPRPDASSTKTELSMRDTIPNAGGVQWA